MSDSFRVLSEAQGVPIPAAFTEALVSRAIVVAELAKKLSATFENCAFVTRWFPVKVATRTDPATLAVP